MTLPTFALARPDSVDEVLALISEERVPYCGGTELLLAMKMGLSRPETLVDVKRVRELQGVRREGDLLVIGSATTHVDVADDPLVTELTPMLSRVEQRVGNPRVRTQGSIGGNLCFAEPKSDVAAALIALDASVTLTSASNSRTVSVQDFIIGPYYAEREADELLTSVSIPVVESRRGSYVKFQVTERPTVGVAVVEDTTTGAARIVIGAVGEIPFVHDLDRLADLDVNAVMVDIDPVADLTGSVEYKRHVTGVFVRRAVAALPGGGDHQ